MNCFICYHDNNLIRPDCLCKTLYVHPICYTKWLQKCPDILTCSICKSSVSLNFVKQYLSIEQLILMSYCGIKNNND